MAGETEPCAGMRGRLILAAAVIGLAGCATETKVPQAAPVPQRMVADPPYNSGPLWPMDAPSIYAKHAILIDARSGRTLYQKNADYRIPPASTQKLLTALLVVESGGLEQPVTIAREDTLVEPTKLGVRPGQRYTRRALLEATLIASQNDAAAALGRDHAGSREAFAREMDERAWRLGARNSHFINANGLPAAQYSTARDMARIAFEAYREPVIRRIVATREAVFLYNTGRTKRLENTNKLLNRSLAYNGMKTGYTVASGRCLISSISSGGRDLILVQLGSKTKYIFDDAERMLAWGLGRSGGFVPPSPATSSGGTMYY
jgi:D-alanyl-D-alanine carboxypeptidase (penicillin-binding protein 5/6)